MSKRRAMNAVARMDPRAAERALPVLQGRAVLLLHAGEMFAVQLRKDGALVFHGFHADAAVHTVQDGRCSCPRGRFQGACKHSEAVEVLYAGVTP